MEVSAHVTEYVNSTFEPAVMGCRSSDVKLTWMICIPRAVSAAQCRQCKQLTLMHSGRCMTRAYGCLQ